MVKINLLARIISPLLTLMVFGCGGGGSPTLPPVGFKVEFTGHNLPSEMTVGQRWLTDVSFKNASARTWPSKPNHKGLNAVNLSYHWLDDKGSPVVFEGLRTPLPHDLSPGESMQLKAAIQAPDRAGRYTLEVTLVQEGVAWFPEHEGGQLAIPVSVVADQSAALPVSGKRPIAAVDSSGTQPATPRAAKAGESALAKQVFQKEAGQKKQVRTRVTQADKSHSPADRQNIGWSVQVGSYAKEQDAQNIVARLKTKGYDAYVNEAEVQGKKWHRVRVGRLPSRTEAEKLQKTLREAEGLPRTILARPW